MKRMYIGIGMLVVLLAVGIGLTAALMAIHAPLADVLDQAGAAAQEGNWPEAEKQLARAQEHWDRWRHVTAAAADHRPMEEMEALFSRLDVLAKLRQADEFTSDCVQLARMAEAMADAQRLTWWNLL